jgi:hypothetical protein
MNTSLPSEYKRTAETKLETLLTEHEYAHITKRSVASVRRDRLLPESGVKTTSSGLERLQPVDLAEYVVDQVS